MVDTWGWSVARWPLAKLRARVAGAIGLVAFSGAGRETERSIRARLGLFLALDAGSWLAIVLLWLLLLGLLAVVVLLAVVGTRWGSKLF